jgi:hypothetical protein
MTQNGRPYLGGARKIIQRVTVRFVPVTINEVYGN